MATKFQVACPPWVLNERQIINQFYQQEREELAYPAIAHYEWLNEHISGIFASSQLYVSLLHGLLVSCSDA